MTYYDTIHKTISATVSTCLTQCIFIFVRRHNVCTTYKSSIAECSSLSQPTTYIRPVRNIDSNVLLIIYSLKRVRVHDWSIITWYRTCLPNARVRISTHLPVSKAQCSWSWSKLTTFSFWAYSNILSQSNT